MSFFLFLFSVLFVAVQSANPWETEYRIPKDVIPISYDMFLNPNLAKGDFGGEITALVNITAPRNWIPIHIKNLNISKTVLTDKAGKPVKVLEAFKYTPNQFWVMKTEQLSPGLFSIYLKFTGSLIENISGFYKSVYYENGTSRSIATTKFEPVDARQAFPCFDEPALKAKFTIRIVRPKDKYSALSNMNVVKEEPGPGPNDVTVHFAETVPMSTYLVCFIVSDFKDSGAAMVDNSGKPFPVKIYSTPGQVQNTLFAKTCAASVAKFYIDYFGIGYPLPKLDLIAIPDFVSGAMENWGLITFRETALLFNEKENSAANAQRVAVVVSHEISHMWFGNLVTMKWWDDLWLNEGFASFMQYKGVDQGIPLCKDWQMLDQAIYDQIHPVLKKDSVVSSHPIIQPVNNPNQINEIFDSISYNKGHAVIKMLEGFMGETNFKKGIQKYLKAHEYSSAATPDLWAFLNKEVNSPDVNVGSVMDTWTRQMGFPVVNVQKTGDSWVLTQKRFLADRNATFDPSESPYGYTWDIPIHYKSDDGKSNLIWLKRSQSSVKIPRATNKDYVKLNNLQLGFYRVNYDLESWKTFENLLKSNHKALDRKDRANLIDDAFCLAGAGNLDYGLALDMTRYLKNEREFLPWATGASALGEVMQLMSSSTFYPGIRKYAKSLVGDLYGSKEGQFSFNVNPADPHPYRQLRVKILSLACRAGLPACLNDAGAIFQQWIKNPDVAVHPDVRGLVYHYGMSAVGGEYEWDVVWERYLKESNPQQKINLLQCLASVKEPWILRRFVEFAKNETYVRSQDYFQALAYISDNPIGTPIVWNFFRNEFPYLVNRFTLYHRTLGTFIATVTSRFSTQVELEEIEAFYKKYPDAGAGANARKTALEKVKNNINWLKNNEPSIGSWLIFETKTKKCEMRKRQFFTCYRIQTPTAILLVHLSKTKDPKEKFWREMKDRWRRELVERGSR